MLKADLRATAKGFTTPSKRLTKQNKTSPLGNAQKRTNVSFTNQKKLSERNSNWYLLNCTASKTLSCWYSLEITMAVCRKDWK